MDRLVCIGRREGSKDASAWRSSAGWWTATIVLVLGMSTGPSLAFDAKALEGLKAKPVCEGCDLAGADLKDAYFPGVILRKSNLMNADLSGGNFNGANLESANFTGADLTGANLKYSVLTNAVFWGARLAGTQLAGAKLDGSNLSGAMLKGAELRGARLSAANLAGADLTGANLEFAEGVDAAQLAEAILCKTRMPDGALNDSGC